MDQEKKHIAELDVEECLKALQSLKESSFDDRTETKKGFDALYRIFNRFKNDSVMSNQGQNVLTLYLKLMQDIIEYVQSP
jgi:hypothetical protein